MYNKLYELLQKINLPLIKEESSSNRAGFPTYRGAVFGMVKPRFKSQKELSRLSKKYPEIYEEIIHIGKQICPFDFLTIQLNHNLVCPPHKDKNNKSRSILVSFGDYTGGEIIIDGVTHNAYHNPIEFDGANLEHYNNPIIGNKYSLVYFT